MLNGTYYLNNTGSRWITLIQGKKETINLTTKSGKSIVRTVILWESYGNSALAHINYKGKKIRVFADEVLED